MSKYKVGEVCFLRGGSAPLTVIAVHKSSKVEVMWFNDMDDGSYAILPEAALVNEAELVAEHKQHNLVQEVISQGIPPFKRCQ